MAKERYRVREEQGVRHEPIKTPGHVSRPTTNQETRYPVTDYEDLRRRQTHFTIEKRQGETQEQYQRRLNTYCAAQIGTIEAYEEQLKLDRLRKLHPLSKSVLEGEEVINELLQLIRDFQSKIQNLTENSPETAEKPEIRKKLQGLKSLL